MGVERQIPEKDDRNGCPHGYRTELHCLECMGQRIADLAAEVERLKVSDLVIPEVVRDLLSPTSQNLWQPSRQEYDAAVFEAYRRGRTEQGPPPPTTVGPPDPPRPPRNRGVR